MKDVYGQLNGRKTLSCEAMQVAVLMGGRGKRLKDQTEQTPKPMVPVLGKPFFEYELELLLLSGFKKFVFLVGYRAEQIEAYFGDGSQYGADVHITYSYDGPSLLGTGGAVVRALPLLEEDFMLIYADSFMDVDYYQIIYRYFKAREDGKKALMAILENAGKLDKSNVFVCDGAIKQYCKNGTAKDALGKMTYIDYGISVFAKKIFTGFSKNQAVDLADIQSSLADAGQYGACEENRRFYEIGTPHALDEFEEYARSRFAKSNSACFIDRDGVVNEIVWREEIGQPDSPLSPEEFHFLPGAERALKQLKAKGFAVFIVTNQPAAAKGKVSLEQLYAVNAYMEQLLEKKGVVLDGVSVCPHHPSGSEGTSELFLIQHCNCRKPKPGMLLDIMKKHNIDVQHSYMIGDSYTDILAGRAAGVKTAFIGDYKCDVCKRLRDNYPDMIGRNLEEIVQKLPEVKKEFG